MNISKFYFYIAIIFFRTLLDFSYVYFVNDIYSHSGFNLNLTASNYIYSWIILLMSFSFLNHNLSKVSDYFFIISILCVIAPLTSFYGLSGREIFPVLITLFSIAIIYIIVNLLNIKAPKLPVFINGISVAALISLSMVVFLVAWYFFSGAVKYFNLNFTKVYDFRDLSAEVANVGVLSYLNVWVYQVFSIFLISFFLLKKYYFLALLIMFIQIFFYGVNGHKTIFFLPFVILGIWFYFNKTKKLIVVPALFCLVVLLSLIIWHVFDEIIIASMFIRRVFFVPAILTYDYFSFFSINQYVFWSNSVLSGIVNYPYELNIPNLIGEFNGSNSRANNGMVSSGYAHAGVLGVILYSIIFGLIIRFVDVFSKNLPVWFSLAIIIVPYRNALISSDLFTVILTHGLLVALFLLMLSRSYGANFERK